MGIGARLEGTAVLLVEGDVRLAARAHHALCKAGAQVIGPAAREDQAIALIESRSLSCAILEIDLGQGVRFKVADALRARGLPFVFMTAHDDVMIPRRFDDIGRIRKPSGFRLAVEAIALMCPAPPAWMSQAPMTPEKALGRIAGPRAQLALPGGMRMPADVVLPDALPSDVLPSDAVRMAHDDLALPPMRPGMTSRPAA